MKINQAYTLNHIAIKKLQAVVVSGSDVKHTVNPVLSLTLNAEMMAYGFIMSESLFNTVKALSAPDIGKLYQQIIPVLKPLTGADVHYQPMYPNFPQQVIEAEEDELYLNALLHYWAAGEWSPEYSILQRSSALEVIKYRPLELTKPASVRAIFTTLLASGDSLSAEDKAIIAWFIQNTKETKLRYPK